MDRIYFEKTQNALVSGEESKSKEYLEKISKLVPSEIIVGFLTISGFIPLIKNPTLIPWAFYGATVLCMVLTPFYLIKQTPIDAPYKPIVHYIISTVAFVVWAYVTVGDKVPGLYYEAPVASLILVGFSLVSGVIPQR